MGFAEALLSPCQCLVWGFNGPSMGLVGVLWALCARHCGLFFQSAGWHPLCCGLLEAFLGPFLGFGGALWASGRPCLPDTLAPTKVPGVLKMI